MAGVGVRVVAGRAFVVVPLVDADDVVVVGAVVTGGVVVVVVVCFPDGRSIMTVCMSAPVDLHLVYSNNFPGQCAKHAYVLDLPHSNAGC